MALGLIAPNSMTGLRCQPVLTPQHASSRKCLAKEQLMIDERPNLPETHEFWYVRFVDGSELRIMNPLPTGL